MCPVQNVTYISGRSSAPRNICSGAFAFAGSGLAELQDTGQVPLQQHLQPTIRARRQRDPLDVAADDLLPCISLG